MGGPPDVAQTIGGHRVIAGAPEVIDGTQDWIGIRRNGHDARKLRLAPGGVKRASIDQPRGPCHDRAGMKGWVGWILLAVSLVIAYQGYQNSQPEPSTEAAARAVVCEGEPDCEVENERPHITKTDVFQRRYEWKTSKGPVHVLCRRDLLFFGAWHCTPKPGSLEGKQ